MNCYHKILQKNVYRTCAGNCDEIASVVSLHRNDKGLEQEPRGKCRTSDEIATPCIQHGSQ